MFLTTKEDIDRSPAEMHAASALAQDMRARIELLLKYEWPVVVRETRAPFIRINHPRLQNTPATPLPQPLWADASRWAVRAGTNAALRWLGFEHFQDTVTGVHFWLRTAPVAATASAAGSAKALLFAPGFGMGIVPYMPFVLQLLRTAWLTALYRTVIILEPPGLSGLAPRAADAAIAAAYPTAEEMAAAVQRLVRERLQLRAIDAIGHSYGGLILAYVEAYAPSVLDRVAFSDSPVLMSHSTFFWPKVFEPTTAAGVLKRVLSGRARSAMGLLAFGELWHQHVIHNCTWFFEYVLRETALQGTNGRKRLFLLSGADDVVASHAIAAYLEHSHKHVRVRLWEGWGHGDGMMLPWNWPTVLESLEAFFMAAEEDEREHEGLDIATKTSPDNDFEAAELAPDTPHLEAPYPVHL